jgi:nuclear receptor-binding protein
MDTEDGVEVVWNEVQFSQRKSYKAQEVCCNFYLHDDLL